MRMEDHAKAVLDLMVERAERGEWEGSATQLVAEVAPVSYYSRIMAILEDAGAIKQMRRGGGRAVSKYLIINPEASLEGVAILDSGKIKLKKYASLEARLDKLESDRSGVDVSKALFNMASRLVNIEKILGITESTDDVEGKE